MRDMKQPINPKEILLDNILIMMSGMVFGQTEAARIVGGLGKLVNLIEEGKIEATKPSSSRNGKWRCRADQVLMHCRNMRTKPRHNQSQTIKTT